METGAEPAAPGESGLERDALHDLYYWMFLTRRVEQTLTNLYRQNKVIGGLYRSLGQEAGAVGTAYALRRRQDGTGDVIAPAIRDLGAMLMMGADAADVMMQYLARAGGPTGGRETNVHFSDFDRGFVGLISHLGVMVEVMTGVALSFRLRGQDRVAVAFAGDGMTSTGGFHEGFNLAAVQRLPLVLVVESNGYAYSTPTRKQTAVESFVDKADGYGVRGESVDGNDVLAVYGAAHRAVEHARGGGGPTLLELVTYRRTGHAEHDPQSYLPEGELQAWEARDPLSRFEARLRENDEATEEELEAIRSRVDREVEAARARALASDMPLPDGAVGDVYAGEPGWTPWTRREPLDPHEA